MEIYLSRREIRRRIQARMGRVTNDAQAQQVMDQINEWIRAAANAVYKRCQWVQNQQETRVSIGIDQRFVDYPENSGPGDVVAMAVWDTGASRYCPLRRGVIPLRLDDEPLVDIGEPDSVAGRGKPTLYELKAQIELWRRPDQAYELKIDHTISPELATDNAESIVDAEAIILHAMAEAFDFEGDSRLADVKRAQYEDQIRALIAERHPLTAIRRGANDRRSVGGRRDLGYVPDSGAWPSVMEP